MSDFKERAAAALEALPEDMRENAIAFLFEQAEKLRVLKTLVQEGLDDVEAGRVEAWTGESMSEIRRMAREISPDEEMPLSAVRE